MLTYEWISTSTLKVTQHIMSSIDTKKSSFFYNLEKWTCSESIDGLHEIKMTPDNIQNFKEVRLKHASEYFKNKKEAEIKRRIDAATDKIKREYSLGTVEWHDDEAEPVSSIMARIAGLKSKPIQLSKEGIEKIFRDYDVDTLGKMLAKKSSKSRSKGEFCGVITITDPQYMHHHFMR